MATSLHAAACHASEPRASHFSQPKKVREDRLRRRAGAAYARLSASGDRVAEALGLSPASISNRKAGLAGFANTLIEIDALERARIDTGPFLNALLETAVEARPTDQLDLLGLACDEQVADSREDLAQTAYLAGRGTLEAWAGELRAYVGQAMLTLRVIGGAR